MALQPDAIGDRFKVAPPHSGGASPVALRPLEIQSACPGLASGGNVRPMPGGEHPVSPQV